MATYLQFIYTTFVEIINVVVLHDSRIQYIYIYIYKSGKQML